MYNLIRIYRQKAHKPMKKTGFLALLITSVLMVGISFASNATYPGFDDKFVVVYAENSQEALDFVNNDWKPFRDAHHDICSVTFDDYQNIMNKYKSLSEDLRKEVNEMADTYQPDFTIGAMINELVKTHYSVLPDGQSKREKLDQSTTIIIAVVVSIFGMSAISVLYILKNKKVIE